MTLGACCILFHVPPCHERHPLPLILNMKPSKLTVGSLRAKRSLAQRKPSTLSSAAANFPDQQKLRTPAAEAKPTKSALKKLAKVARLEKKEKAKRDKQLEKAHQQPQPENGDAPPPLVDAPTDSEVIKDPVQPSAPVEPTPTAPIFSEPEHVKAPAPPAPEPEPILKRELAPAPSVVSTPSAPEPVVLEEKKLPVSHPLPSLDSEQGKKRQSFITRLVWSLIMVFGFIGLYVHLRLSCIDLPVY